MKIIPNPDKEFFEMARESMRNNDGYCPCALMKEEDYKCPCKEFREQKDEGLCYCGLYAKVRSQE